MFTICHPLLYKHELTEYSEHWEIGVILNPTLPVRRRSYRTTPRAQSQYVQGWDFNPASQPQSSCSCRLLHVTLQFIHSSVQDCQLSSYRRVKPKIHVTANKALVQGSPLPLFLHLLQGKSCTAWWLNKKERKRMEAGLVWLLWWAHPYVPVPGSLHSLFPPPGECLPPDSYRVGTFTSLLSLLKGALLSKDFLPVQYQITFLLPP